MDPFGTHSGVSSSIGERSERAQPRFQVRDRMFDVECWHVTVLSSAIEKHAGTVTAVRRDRFAPAERSLGLWAYGARMTSSRAEIVETTTRMAVFTDARRWEELAGVF